MADKSALPSQQNIQIKPDNGSDTNIPTDTKNGVGEDASDPRQISFDALFARLTDGFGQACEQEGVQTAIAIAIHPNEKHPIVFIRGHEYDVGVLVASVLKGLTSALMGPLNPYHDPDAD